MHRIVSIGMTIGLAIPLAVVAATGAGAATKPGAVDAPTAALSRHVVVESPLTAAPGGTQTRLDVACPRGTRVVGGGAYILGTSTGSSINTSAPVFDGRRWRVAVNNSGSVFDNAFRAYAVCVSGIADYQVVEGVGVDNPSGKQNVADALCSTGTVPLGGGGAPIEAVPTVNLNSTFPLTNGWRTRVNNTGPDDDFVIPYAICGRAPAGYRQSLGTQTFTKPSSQGQAAAACPAGTRVLSGGTTSGLGETLVNINSLYHSSSSVWQVFENNNSGQVQALRARAVCATVSTP